MARNHLSIVYPETEKQRKRCIKRVANLVLTVGLLMILAFALLRNAGNAEPLVPTVAVIECTPSAAPYIAKELDAVDLYWDPGRCRWGLSLPRGKKIVDVEEEK